MSVTVTNLVAAPACKGQNPVVTVSLTDIANVLPTLVGHTCTTSGGRTGRVAEVFSGGTQFLVAPNNMGSRFDSNSTPGILALNETITIN
jgi:hypothetical protein